MQRSGTNPFYCGFKFKSQLIFNTPFVKKLSKKKFFNGLIKEAANFGEEILWIWLFW
jgi:hypothetical protein